FKLEQSMESASTETGRSDISQRITRTVVTRTNYGNRGVDTAIGVGNAGAVESFLSRRTTEIAEDVLLDSGSRGDSVSSTRADLSQGDLSSYKKRIDANVEQQREHSDMMAGLQRKVEDYRRRIADIEGQIVSQKTDEKVTFSMTDMEEIWAPDIRTVEGIDYELCTRLDEERRRNEELRYQNEQLHAEMQRIRQQFELNIRDKERIYQNREKNLAQYLSDEQRKMMDLWAELQQVRRQCAEYKEQTERDLENQKNEFIKVMRSVSGIARQISIASERPIFSESNETCAVQDTVLLEALKRFREQQQAPMLGDAELQTELMRKYEVAIERIVELESRDDGSLSKVSTLEVELKRTKDRLNECLEALRKVNALAKENRSQSDRKRSRSLSPVGEVVPAEVVRNIRASIRARDNEIQQLQRKLRTAEIEIHELVTRFESAEDARRRVDKQLTDSKRELNVQLTAVDDAAREIRRLEERLRAAESERTLAENARKHLEEEIRRLKLVFDQSTADSERKAIEESEQRNRLIEEEYKTRITELTRRIDDLLDDNKRIKSDHNCLKEKFRDLEIDYNATLRKVDEKDQALRHLEGVKRDLLKDLENQRARFDAVTSELDNLETNFTTTARNTAVIELSVKEIKQQRDEINKQKDDLEQRLADLKHKMEIEIGAREEIEKVSQRHLEEVEKLKTEITDYEGQVMMLRRHNDELDTQQRTSQAKITTLENSLTSAQKEIIKLNELNNKLQKEKNEIMNLKQRSDADLDQLRERIRKVEQEIDKVKVENKELHENEQKANVAYKEETNRAHLLQRELDDAKIELDELRKQLKQLDEDYKERIELALRTEVAPDKIETYETTHITEIRLKEADDKYRLELERLENDKDELMRRIRQLEDELAEKQRIIERQQNDIDDLKAQYQIEIDRLKAEVANMQTKFQSELDDERDQYNHNLEAMKATEEDLRNKLTTTEKKVEDAISREKILQKEITDWEEKYTTIAKELRAAHDEIEVIRGDAEKEIQSWKTEAHTSQNELKTAETKIEALKTQLATANERVTTLNKTINEQAVKIRELNSQIRRLEEELSDAKSLAATNEADLERVFARLKITEEQYGSLQLENNKLKATIDSMQCEIDMLKNTNASQESELERSKKKLHTMTIAAKETTEELEKTRNERDRFDKAYREKTKQFDQLKETIQAYETKIIRLRQELEDATEKLLSAETERNNLRAEMNKLQQELQFGKEQMLRKSDEFHAALEDLASAHRASEDGRVNAIQELEIKKFEISDLQSRLDNADQRLASLQQEYLNADKERDMLSDSLRRFQTIIGRSVSTIIPEGGVPDMHTIDVQVQKLISRIDKLEREKNEYRESLGRLKRKTSDSQIAISKHETIYKTVEEKIVDVEEEKRKTDIKLASAKELLKSQEDALKQRDEERRAMKSKIVAIELEARGKDAQIRHLNDLVKNLRNELETSQRENRTLREREDRWDMKKITLERKIYDRDGDSEKINLLTSAFEAERQNLNDSLKKLAIKLQESESRYADLSDDANRLKKDLTKAERTEAELRRSLDEQTRIARDGEHLRSQLSILQNDLTNLTNRKQQLENELMTLRLEFREQKQHFHDASTRVADLQRQLSDALNEKNRLSDQLHRLEKTITQQRNTENDLRQQLARLVDERRSLQNEIEDFRRRIGNFESERKTTSEKIEELTKIRVLLAKKIDFLENEKRNAQAVINETASQREAIENSLNALERENKELYRNCTQLQQQIAQLELDNGNRLMALTNKQKEEHERFVQSVKLEKAQVEKIIENRDRTQKNRIKQLENQVNIMREQLNHERRRYRDAADRMLISDMSKLSAATFGAGNSGVSSAGGVYPQTDSFDYVIGNHSGYMAQFLSTAFMPTGTSDHYRMSSTAASLKEPVDITKATSGTSYRTSGIGSIHGDPMVSLEQRSAENADSDIRKKTTIVVHMKSTDSSYSE
uniref:Spindle-and centromere-associated protein n=4 Tax=Parascaris univalens TaxID=6257 RepID=A0A915BWD1_PARUN